MGAEAEVQKALKNALTGAGLTVYDFVPQATDGGAITNWPYVEVGEVLFGEWDTAPELGFTITARIHSRSRSASALEAKLLQGVIYATLHRHELTIAGQRNISLIRESSLCLRTPENDFHGVCEYRGLIETI